MGDEVNGTVVNAASGGPEAMKTPKELRFDGDQLAGNSDSIIQRVIDEFKQLQRQPIEKSRMHLSVLAGSREQALPRLESLRSAIAKTGRLASSQYSIGYREDEGRTLKRLVNWFRL